VNPQPPVSPTGGSGGVPSVVSAGDRDQLRRFIAYPYNRYRDFPHWVPPLWIAEWQRFDPRKNPFLDYGTIEPFLALRNGQVVGRIALIDDRRHNEIHRDNAAVFGFFEADDLEAATALLATADSWARARGRHVLRGPLSPSLNDVAGLLIDGFDEDPMLMMPWNPPEYGAFIEHAGFRKAKDLYAWISNLNEPGAERLALLAQRVQQRSQIAIRSIDLRHFKEELQRFRIVYSLAWQDNWGFVPPTEREFSYLAEQLRPIVEPDFVICAEVNGVLAACAVGVPDINQVLKSTSGRLSLRLLWRFLRRRRIINQGRLLLLGVLPEFRNIGIYPLLLSELRRRALPRNYRRVEFSWVLEDNDNINRPLMAAGVSRYKTYRLYEKQL
jgi:GNAT superfamily N-acetyltransferase